MYFWKFKWEKSALYSGSFSAAQFVLPCNLVSEFPCSSDLNHFQFYCEIFVQEK